MKLAYLLLLAVVGREARAAPCELPKAIDCYDKGVALFKAQDPEAATWFERACQSNVAEGCTELGFLAMEGMLVPRDDGAALAASQRGCELGSGLACNNAFVLVRDGRATRRDDVELRRLAVRSCALDDGEGCYLAAAVYGEPLGGTLDDKRADEALAQSCKLEFGMACAVIAHRRLEGDGAKKDEVGGVKMMAHACELGSGEACVIVGGWSLEGAHGLRADMEKAIALFNAACEVGTQEGCAKAQELIAKSAAGTLTGTLARKSGKRVLVKLGAGDAPPVGARGELVADAVLGTVSVKRVDGTTLELTLEREEAGARWKPGIGLSLAWKRTAPQAAPQ